MAYTQQDRDYLAAVVYGEARGEIPEGQAAVAHTVVNRANATGQSIPQVALDYRQYTALDPEDHNRQAIEQGAGRDDAAWQAVQEIATQVLTGQIPDPTGGATHYYAPEAMRAQTGRSDPAWGRGHAGWDETTVIGGHVFGHAAGGVPDNPDSENRPPLAFADANSGIPLSPAEQAIGEVFGPAQPVQPPPTPATPQEIQLAMNPVADRTIFNYQPPEFELEIADGAPARVEAGWDRLEPALVNRLESATSQLPSDVVDKLRVTSTFRSESPNHRGQALDIRNSNLTQFEEAQVVAALADAGISGIGVYGPGNPQDFGPHIHADVSAMYNSPDSLFQPNVRTDNPTLNSLVDAIDYGSEISDAWFGGTRPNPTPTATVANQGDGSLDAPTPAPAPAVNAAKAFENLTPPVSTSMQNSPADFQYTAQNNQAVQRELQREQESTPRVSSSYSAPTPAPAQREETTPRPSESYNSGGGSSDIYNSGMSSLSSVFQQASQPRPEETTPRLSEQTRYRTESVQVANPQYEMWERGNRQAVTDSSFANQTAAEIAMGRRPVAYDPGPAPARTITVERQVPYTVQVPMPAPSVAQAPPVQLTPPAAPKPTGINAFLNSLTGNAPDAPAPAPWEVHTGAGGSWAYGGTDQPSTSNAQSQGYKDQQSSGGSSVGGGGTVICTYFYKKGEIDRLQYQANMVWTTSRIPDQTFRGYHFWAVPYVKLMRKSPLAERIMLPILKARTDELLFRLGKREKGSLGGKLARLILESASWVIGAFVPQTDWKQLWETELND